MKRVLIFIFLVSAAQAMGQNFNPDFKPYREKIKIDGDYKHDSANFIFPDTLKNGFFRIALYSFNTANTDIGATYIDKKRNTFKVFLYPGELPSAKRLQSQLYAYRVILNDVKGKNQVVFKTLPGDKFDSRGAEIVFKATYPSYLALYECGEWMFKIRMEMTELDNEEMLNLSAEIIDEFKPQKIIAQNPLKVSFYTGVSETLFKDSVLLAGALNADAAFTMWILENVPQKELASGVPGYFIEAHLAAVDSALSFIQKYQHLKTDYSTFYFNHLQAIKDAGFLKEYIMEENAYLLELKNPYEFNFRGFKKWKRKNKSEIDYILDFFQNYFLPVEN